MFYDFIDFIQSINWQEVFKWAKIVSGTLSILFFIGIVILIIKLNALGIALKEVSAAINVSAVPKRRLVKRWDQIRQKFEQRDEANMKLAIIDADKMLDSLIERMGYHGASMGERLKQIKIGQFPRINEIWDAHNLRNSIVHDPEYRLDHEEVVKAMKTYEAVFQDLEVI